MTNDAFEPNADHGVPPPKRRLWRILATVLFIYCCWLSMLAVHEAGHVLHAWASGGRTERVVVPLAGFSRTDVAVNPHPQFVAWGGPIWGCLIPLMIAAAAWRSPHRRRALFFLGFCLIANGGYLSVGAFERAGDADDLLRHGAPQWLLVLVGLAAAASGLYVWHRLGEEFRSRRAQTTSGSES